MPGAGIADTLMLHSVPPNANSHVVHHIAQNRARAAELNMHQAMTTGLSGAALGRPYLQGPVQAGTGFSYPWQMQGQAVYGAPASHHFPGILYAHPNSGPDTDTMAGVTDTFVSSRSSGHAHGGHSASAHQVPPAASWLFPPNMVGMSMLQGAMRPPYPVEMGGSSPAMFRYPAVSSHPHAIGPYPLPHAVAPAQLPTSMWNHAQGFQQESHRPQNSIKAPESQGGAAQPFAAGMTFIAKNGTVLKRRREETRSNGVAGVIDRGGSGMAAYQVRHGDSEEDREEDNEPEAGEGEGDGEDWQPSGRRGGDRSTRRGGGKARHPAGPGWARELVAADAAAPPALGKEQRQPGPVAAAVYGDGVDAEMSESGHAWTDELQTQDGPPQDGVVASNGHMRVRRSAKVARHVLAGAVWAALPLSAQPACLSRLMAGTPRIRSGVGVAEEGRGEAAEAWIGPRGPNGWVQLHPRGDQPNSGLGRSCWRGSSDDESDSEDEISATRSLGALPTEAAIQASVNRLRMRWASAARTALVTEMERGSQSTQAKPLPDQGKPGATLPLTARIPASLPLACARVGDGSLLARMPSSQRLVAVGIRFPRAETVPVGVDAQANVAPVAPSASPSSLPAVVKSDAHVGETTPAEGTAASPSEPEPAAVQNGAAMLSTKEADALDVVQPRNRSANMLPFARPDGSRGRLWLVGVARAGRAGRREVEEMSSSLRDDVSLELELEQEQDQELIGHKMLGCAPDTLLLAIEQARAWVAMRERWAGPRCVKHGGGQPVSLQWAPLGSRSLSAKPSARLAWVAGAAAALVRTENRVDALLVAGGNSVVENRRKRVRLASSWALKRPGVVAAAVSSCRNREEAKREHGMEIAEPMEMGVAVKAADQGVGDVFDDDDDDGDTGEDEQEEGEVWAGRAGPSAAADGISAKHVQWRARARVVGLTATATALAAVDSLVVGRLEDGSVAHPISALRFKSASEPTTGRAGMLVANVLPLPAPLPSIISQRVVSLHACPARELLQTLQGLPGSAIPVPPPLSSAQPTEPPTVQSVLVTGGVGTLFASLAVGAASPHEGPALGEALRRMRRQASEIVLGPGTSAAATCATPDEGFAMVLCAIPIDPPAGQMHAMTPLDAALVVPCLHTTIIAVVPLPPVQLPIEVHRQGDDAAGAGAQRTVPCCEVVRFDSLDTSQLRDMAAETPGSAKMLANLALTDVSAILPLQRLLDAAASHHAPTEAAKASPSPSYGLQSHAAASLNSAEQADLTQSVSQAQPAADSMRDH